MPLSKDRVLHRASSASMSGSDSEVDAPQARSQGALEEVKEIERDELMFPDEVDTPTDCPVRERFAHYRPLPSYRKTPWDSNTSLPPAYARVVQFEHFRRAVRNAHQEAALSPVKPHTYIAFLLKSVPVSVAQRMRGWTGPLIATSLLRYEHLPTVMHCLVQRSVSKSRCCGSDRVSTRPLLVATGSVVGANPDRIVLKRVVLTGVPYRAHKTRATIRYMFFDPEDVKHYKNVPLWTKHGRLGRIEESLGTHGAMKATFDGTILHSDTVCLSLYRRVFPEWVSGSTCDTLDETGITNTVVDR
ncbi:ribosome bioproteinsis protein tsr1 [Cyanidiococcus yangmingshanensis]|uniref:Ribosome bioproteinsis protein tsr1 n=1 Tax=Cyanidiococcus yangmingshanensis TaxID=2690220 RepID=A0A7J7ICW4_9RHOD|nr:ribosome bioproteinsis protein tsr1 [Cyanidiococcus yangmingshanensis]